MGVYLKHGDVKGGATAGSQTDWIAAHSFAWGMDVPIHTGIPTGRSVYKAFTIAKSVDIATPPLLRHAAQNMISNESLVRFVSTDSSDRPLLEILFKDVRVVGVDYELADGAMNERVSFYFRAYEMTYMDPQTGSGVVTFEDDLSDRD